MITDHPTFKKMLATGEEQFGKLASQLIANERFISTLQAAVTKAISAKGLLDKQLVAALEALHVPTTADLEKLNDRLDEVERIFEGLSQKVDAIAERLGSSR